VVREDPPAILDANEQAQLARAILSAPLVLQAPRSSDSANAQTSEPGPWKIEPSKLAEWLVIERVASPEGAHYQVGLDENKLQTFLNGIAPALARQAANARFTFNADTHKLEALQAAVIGRSLNVKASVQTIQEQLLKGQHTRTYPWTTLNPRWATMPQPNNWASGNWLARTPRIFAAPARNASRISKLPPGNFVGY
jgi:hypothetical protein